MGALDGQDGRGHRIEDLETTKSEAVDPTATAFGAENNNVSMPPPPIFWSPPDVGMSARDAQMTSAPEAYGIAGYGATTTTPPAPLSPSPNTPESHPLADQPTVRTAIPVANPSLARPVAPSAPRVGLAELAQIETVRTPAMPSPVAAPTPTHVVATPALPAFGAAPAAPVAPPPFATPATPFPPSAPALSSTPLFPTEPESARSRKTSPLWWLLVAVLALATVSGWLAYAAYRAPANFVSQTVCADLTSGSSHPLYASLSPRLRATIPVDEFTSVLDTATQGGQAIHGCARQGAYSYVPGGATAHAGVVLTRANGQHVAGTLTLISSAGSWWVDDLSPSLLGVDLGALAAANTYCADTTSQNIAALYALQGSALRQGISLADFTATAHLHATIDGKVTHCAITSLSGASASNSATFNLSVTWARLGQRSGTITFDQEDGAWKVSALSAAVQGSDLGAITTAERFCADIASGSYQDAYGLFSTGFRGQGTEQAFAAIMNGKKTGLKYSKCQLNINTFTFSGSNASIQGQLTVTMVATKKTLTTPMMLSFVNEKGAWRLNNLS